MVNENFTILITKALLHVSFFLPSEVHLHSIAEIFSFREHIMLLTLQFGNIKENVLFEWG